MAEVQQTINYESGAVNTALASLKHNMALITDTRWAMPSCQALQEILTNVQERPLF